MRKNLEETWENFTEDEDSLRKEAESEAKYEAERKASGCPGYEECEDPDCKYCNADYNSEMMEITSDWNWR